MAPMTINSAQTGSTLQSPKVSIFLPTFARYREGYLQRAIESALVQTWQDFELLVVDDGSIDGTAGYLAQLAAEDPRVKHIRLDKNTGLPAYALAQAYDSASGEYFAWLFDDCQLEPDHLQTLVDFHLRHPHLGMVYARAKAQLTDEHSFTIGEPIDIEAMREGLNSIPNVCALLPRSTIEKVGWYDPHVILKRLCDWDLWLRIASEFEIGFVDRVLATEYGVGLPGSLGRLNQDNTALAKQYSRSQRNHRLVPSELTLDDAYRVDLGIDLDAGGIAALESAFFEHRLFTMDVQGATDSAARLRDLGLLDAAMERLALQQGNTSGDSAETLFVATVNYMRSRLSDYSRSMIQLEVTTRAALAAADERMDNLTTAQRELIASHAHREQAAKLIMELQEQISVLMKAAAPTPVEIFNEQQARELAEAKYSLFVFRDAADRRLELIQALEAQLELKNAGGQPSPHADTKYASATGGQHGKKPRTVSKRKAR